jgi:hypothetical protein
MARTVVSKTLEWGAKAVNAVKQAWEPTKAIAKMAVAWVAEKVERVVAWVKNVGERVWEKFNDLIERGEKYDEARLIASLRKTLDEITSAAEATLAQDSLSSFDDYRYAMAALRICKRFLASLSGSGLQETNEAGLKAISALKKLFLEGGLEEAAQVAEVGFLDAYCQSAMDCPGGFLELGSECVGALWTAEAAAIEARLKALGVEISRGKIDKMAAESAGDLSGQENASAWVARCSAEEQELRKRNAEVELASRVLEGIIDVDSKRETEVMMIRDAHTAGQILVRWQFGVEMEPGDKEFLIAFGQCFGARAAQRRRKVEEGFATDTESETQTATPVG